MSGFLDSPIEYCPLINRYVLLDQTQKACARDERCGAWPCPLARYFASERAAETLAAKESQREREGS